MHARINRAMKANLKNRWIIIPAVFIGVLALWLLVMFRSQPERLDLPEASRAVRVIEVPRVTVIPTLTGTGNVKPGQTWTAVAQVSGVIIDINPRFKKGEVMRKDEVVLIIDPSDYELAIEQAGNNIEATRTQLADIDVKEGNTRKLLKIEEQSLALNRKELARKKTILAKGVISKSDYEKEKRNVLAQQQQVEAQRNALNLYPTERQRLTAELARLESQLAAATLNLERTTIRMPMTGRIAEANVEINQFVSKGEVLAIADGNETAEIEVQIPMGRMAGLLRSTQQLDLSATDMTQIAEQLGISARVFLRHNNIEAEWPARVMRFSDTIDPRTRTIGVYVEVLGPYAMVQPGIRPPLIKGLFVDVELQGRPRPDSLVVPLSALHGNTVYVLNQENRLEKRGVIIGLIGSEYAVIESGLSEKERIVISDLVPAIDGMLLQPIPDQASLQRLIREATAARESGAS
jgi:membrane fusion protein, multidrug efflux system